VLRGAGAAVTHVAALSRDHLDRLDKVLAEPMRTELMREREVDEASGRREVAQQAVRDAHALLQRRRRAYTALSSREGGGADAADKVRRAEASVAAAERALESRQQQLESITAGIQREMVRVMRSRRAMLTSQLLELARTQHRLAVGRRDVWDTLIHEVLKPDEALLARANDAVQSRLEGAHVDARAAEADEREYQDRKQYRGPDLADHADQDDRGGAAGLEAEDDYNAPHTVHVGTQPIVQPLSPEDAVLGADANDGAARGGGAHSYNVHGDDAFAGASQDEKNAFGDDAY
jgi:hypothetical protein